MWRKFTLIGLFLVLVIIGLIAGGMSVLESLKRQSDVKTLMIEAQQMIDLSQQFKTKYGGVPGDLATATTLWGRMPECVVPEGNTLVDAAPTGRGTCNGEGDGLVESTTMLPTTPSEIFLYWQHLALTGMIQGEYTGLTGGNYAQCILGTNCPAFKAFGATAVASDFTWQGTGKNGWWGTKTAGSGNWLGIGAPTDGLSWPFVPLLTTKEASGIDIKTDDGKPASGKLMMMGCQLYQSGCMVDDKGAQPGPDCDAFAAVAQYQLSQSGPVCTPMLKFPN